MVRVGYGLRRPIAAKCELGHSGDSQSKAYLSYISSSILYSLGLSESSIVLDLSTTRRIVHDTPVN